MPRLLDYLMVFLTAMFKFVFAPIMGALRQLSVLETWICTVLGMTTSVIIFLHIGLRLRDWYFRNFFKKRRIFSRRSRMTVRIWRKYGIIGIAALTPIFFSPVIGTLIAASFGEKKTSVVLYMGISAAFWGLLLSILTINFGATSLEQVKELLMK